MPPTQLQHRRTHNLLLIKKLLDCRDNASPFTLVVDSLKQSARPLLRDITQRATVSMSCQTYHTLTTPQKSRTRTVYISWDTLNKPAGVEVFLSAGSWDLSRLEKELRLLLNDAKQREQTSILQEQYTEY